MRRATGGIRLPRHPRRLDRAGCLAVVSAATALSAATGLRWAVARELPDRGLPGLSESLARARRQGQLFLLPPGSRSWLDLRYAHADTGYAMALMLVWSYGASRTPADRASPGDYVEVAMWHLRLLSPPHTHRMLEHVEAALVRHRSATRTAADESP